MFWTEESEVVGLFRRVYVLEGSVDFESFYWLLTLNQHKKRHKFWVYFDFAVKRNGVAQLIVQLLLMCKLLVEIWVLYGFVYRMERLVDFSAVREHPLVHGLVHQLIGLGRVPTGDFLID